ncbi:hypothetical protein WOLCODRAFT_148492 [Wolfiporia cocos MD-104 SS10]|uniref:Uncharacterized protein n=1 Tax=Wolfiporia cocos (strain MD-104) TaxID=742152 RepID=A0A2H3JEM4_WOLCO|nr:hypothetical protein WOLCODRAFT_148492 [Wolfiporia cocos MD-104 SS10]
MDRTSASGGWELISDDWPFGYVSLVRLDDMGLVPSPPSSDSAIFNHNSGIYGERRTWHTLDNRSSGGYIELLLLAATSEHPGRSGAGSGHSLLGVKGEVLIDRHSRPYLDTMSSLNRAHGQAVLERIRYIVGKLHRTVKTLSIAARQIRYGLRAQYYSRDCSDPLDATIASQTGACYKPTRAPPANHNAGTGLAAVTGIVADHHTTANCTNMSANPASFTSDRGSRNPCTRDGTLKQRAYKNCHAQFENGQTVFFIRGDGKGVRLGRFLEDEISRLPNAQSPAFTDEFPSIRPSLRIYLTGCPEYEPQVYVKIKRGQGYVSKTVGDLAKIFNDRVRSAMTAVKQGTPPDFVLEDLVLLRAEQVARGSIQLVLDLDRRTQGTN